MSRYKRITSDQMVRAVEAQFKRYEVKTTFERKISEGKSLKIAIDETREEFELSPGYQIKVELSITF